MCSGDGRGDILCLETRGRITGWLNRKDGMMNVGQIKFAEAWSVSSDSGVHIPPLPLLHGILISRLRILGTVPTSVSPTWKSRDVPISSSGSTSTQERARCSPIMDSKVLVARPEGARLLGRIVEFSTPPSVAARPWYVILACCPITTAPDAFTHSTLRTRMV